MLLSELIEDLQAKFEQHGDMKCYTNGEYGSSSSEHLAKHYVSVGEARLEIDDLTLNYDVKKGYLENDSELVLNIGGY